MAVTLSSIVVYPIKSCRGIAVEEAVVSEIGLSGDREWQFVDADHGGVTQRQHRELATVQPEPLPDGGLRLSAPGCRTIEVDASGPTTTVTSLFGVPVPAFDAGDAAAQWFDDLTGTAGRLVKMADPRGWRMPGDLDIFGQSAPFSDAAPILVAAQASCDWLVERASEPFAIDRFRPNLVVTGSDPWAEDTWSTFEIGAVSLRTAAPWPRCQIPQIDQVTSERHREPAKALRAHRWCTDAPTVKGGFRQIIEGSGLFGIGCSIAPAGATIRVGDEVEVTATVRPILPMELTAADEPEGPNRTSS